MSNGAFLHFANSTIKRQSVKIYVWCSFSTPLPSNGVMVSGLFE